MPAVLFEMPSNFINASMFLLCFASIFRNYFDKFLITLTSTNAVLFTLIYVQCKMCMSSNGYGAYFMLMESNVDKSIINEMKYSLGEFSSKVIFIVNDTLLIYSSGTHSKNYNGLKSHV